MSYTSLSSHTRTARKEHKCIWCAEKIVPGERYDHRVGIFEGEMQDNKWHLECGEAASEWMRENGEDSFDPYEHKRPTQRLGLVNEKVIQLSYA